MPQALLSWLLPCSRMLAAFGGGYLFAYSATLLLNQWLPLESADAQLLSSLLGVVWYAAAVIWAFTRTVQWQEWLLVPASVPLLALAYAPVMLSPL